MRFERSGAKACLVFAEDPGAANSLAPIVEGLIEQGWKVDVVAHGLAEDMLRVRGFELRSTPRDETPAALIRETNPHVFVVGTSVNRDSVGLRLIDACKDIGIPSVGVIDARMNAMHRFRGGTSDPLTYAPDWLLVPDDWTAAAFAGLGLSSDRIRATGNPHHDHVLQVRAELEREGRDAVRRRVFGEAPRRPVLVFISESVARHERPAANPRLHRYTLRGNRRSTGRTEIVLEELLRILNRMAPSPQLVVRPHPRDDRNDYRPYREAVAAIVDGGSSLELVFAADAVVGATSALLVEAALIGTPVLSVLPSIEERIWLPSLEGVDIPNVADRSELEAALRALLAKAGERAEWPAPIDATARAVQFLEQVLVTVAEES